ncbi:MAG: hypothetical protein KGI66_01385 [Patescibacteria group bacterium]|nr:hypothetical protein [Patescibacteria group bacterium]
MQESAINWIRVSALVILVMRELTHPPKNHGKGQEAAGAPGSTAANASTGASGGIGYSRKALFRAFLFVADFPFGKQMRTHAAPT